jgi:hypothetical protein
VLEVEFTITRLTYNPFNPRPFPSYSNAGTVDVSFCFRSVQVRGLQETVPDVCDRPGPVQETVRWLHGAQRPDKRLERLPPPLSAVHRYQFRSRTTTTYTPINSSCMRCRLRRHRPLPFPWLSPVSYSTHRRTSRRTLCPPLIVPSHPYPLPTTSISLLTAVTCFRRVPPSIRCSLRRTDDGVRAVDVPISYNIVISVFDVRLYIIFVLSCLPYTATT